MPNDSVKIYVGSDRSQLLPTLVLEHSIKRHTDLAIELFRIDNTLAPMPKEVRFLPYTNFSYSRFAIPKLANFKGKAIYLDSDMIVFRDIKELWETPLQGKKILLEAPYPGVKDTGRRAAVMLLNCGELPWEVIQIIDRLGKDYSYDELMSLYPLVREDEIGRTIPFGWNSLDKVGEYTRLLHFTDIARQPWVYPANPVGHYWLDEVKLMLDKGVLKAALIQQEIDAGFARPSLLADLGLDDRFSESLSHDQLQAIDDEAAYQANKPLFDMMHNRKLAIKTHKTAMRKQTIKNLLTHPLRTLGKHHETT